MSEILNKKDVKKLARSFRTTANRVLNSDCDAFDNNLKRLISYIKDIPLIYNYVEQCISKSAKFDIEGDVKSVTNSFDEYTFDDPIDINDEVSYKFQILEYITSHDICFESYVYYFSNEKSFQEKVNGFCNKFILPLVNYINGKIEELCIEIGMDEDSKYIISASSGGQINIAKDNSTINASQNNTVSNIYDKLVNDLNNCKIDKEIKESIEEVVGGLKEEMEKEKPRKTILNSLINTLNKFKSKIPDAIAIAADITELVTFISNGVNIK